MVKDNRQGGAMQDKEVRLECLRLAASFPEYGSAPLTTAQKYYDFVQSGHIDLPPRARKVAPKLIDATKRFKRPS